MKQLNPVAVLNELVESFENNIEVYKTTKYDEENTKIDFIDKFFALLGWDVNNTSGASEDFREVIREDKIVIQGRPKSPDYSFKIGKERQFFVEAKKPSVNIHDNIQSAFQLRRYAYTAGLPISILTNFEEFAVYDTNIKPNENDNASVARIFYCKFNEYTKHWEFLSNTISKQAVWQGKLKKYTLDNTKKKGTQSVDKELLKLIDTWRFELAKNIALRNKELDIYQLNEAVQMIIDRIIFLRMAEDRNTEVYGALQTMSEKKEIYQLLVKYFVVSNSKYNSGLFASKPWLDNLSIDDKIFKTIIHDIYYPMPYEFSVLPIEILGQIYEQFLGKTITLSNRHVADVEEKPEVRKAGGVYYTPKYIVDYIVENTVGKKIGVQGLGDRGQGLDTPDPIPQTLYPNFNTNIGEKNEQDSNLSGFDSLEGSVEFDRDDLQGDNKFSERGDIRVDQSDKKSGGINSSKYSRRIRQEPQEGISESSVNSEWLSSRIRNSSLDSSSDKLHDKGKSSAGLETSSISGKITISPSKITKNSLNPIPYTPNPIPQPLSPKSIEKLTILDPACGSGSFLVGAYKFLLNYHIEYYTKPVNVKKALKEGRIYESGHRVQDSSTKPNTPNPIPYTPSPKPHTGKSYSLTIREKKKILLNNIYGVDIDSQAVEVTKLSLLLTLMEGEIVESRGQLFLKSISEALLPNLDNNIKCGNSLIGTDFYHDKDLQLFNKDEQRKINCFDWEVEFKKIIKAGGFDVVIGNPPYGAYLTKDVKEYLKKKYIFVSDYESAQYFIATSENLNKIGGYVSFIIPNTLFLNLYAQNFRKFVISSFIIKQLANLSELDVFKNATVRTIIPILQKGQYYNSDIKIIVFQEPQLFKQVGSVTQKKLDDNDKYWISVLSDTNSTPLKNKIIILSEPLNNILEISQGLIPYDKYRGHDEYTIKNRIWHSNKKLNNTYKKELRGGDVTRYSVIWNGKQWISYGPWLAAPRKPQFFIEPRLLFREITDPKRHLLHVAFINEEFYNNPGLINCIPRNNEYSLLYILGISASHLIAYWHFNSSPKANKGVFPKILVNDVRNLPIRKIDFSNKSEKAKHDRMVSLVEQMLEAQKEAHSDKNITESDMKLAQQRINILDKQIDTLVYDLYELTAEEIKIVEDEE